MRISRRRTAIAVVTVVAIGYAYLWWSSQGSVIPGRYVGTTLDAKATVVDRLAPDGTFVSEITMPGETRPKITSRGRWRVSGRVLIFETGATAAAPVGLLHRITERFAAPMFTSEETYLGIVSADDTGLVLSFGKDITTGAEITQTLTRLPDEP